MKDYVNKICRRGALSSEVAEESVVWTPSGQKVRQATQEHQVGQPHPGEPRVLI